jgi:uncharacterized protein (TIGR02145 family)
MHQKLKMKKQLLLLLLIFCTSILSAQIILPTYQGTQYNNAFNCGSSTVSDIAGNEYTTVQIGDQCWMAENLKYLPEVMNPSSGSENIPHYYVYNYNGTEVSEAKATTNYQTYGVLYNFFAAKNACPNGWHLPNYSEWQELNDYLDGETVAGGKLKETGIAHWNTPNSGATNEYGFTALPSGGRFLTGSFGGIKNYGTWWCNTQYDASNAYYRNVSYHNTNLTSYYLNNEHGFSVRCIKD